MSLASKAILLKNLPLKEYLRHCVKRKRILPVNFGTAHQWHALALQSAPMLSQLRDKFKGRSIVCIGNGPSINKTDISQLNNQVCIGVNIAYKLLPDISPQYFVSMVQDPKRFNEIQSELKELNHHLMLSNCNHHENHYPPSWVDVTNKLISVYILKHRWAINRNGAKIESIFSEGFEKDFHRGVFCGHTVIFSAIQLAYFMGAKRIICIGIDMDYSGPISFTGSGKHIWANFSYEEHAQQMFIKQRNSLAEEGIELINATPGGKVNDLDRMSLEEALGNKG